MTAGKRRALLGLAGAATVLIPIPVGWDDGCNRHSGTRFPAAQALYVLAVKPERPFVPPPNELYGGGTMTLVLCKEPRGLPTHRRSAP
jgi:hypothetical protein